VALYDDLFALQPSPVVALNRAIAIGRRDGPAAGLEALTPLVHHPTLRSYHLLHAATGHFLTQQGQREDAIAAYQRALQCPLSTPERQFLHAQLNALT
jgi:RNA polymerase sigma-70 factor (ECF subfamily)